MKLNKVLTIALLVLLAFSVWQYFKINGLERDKTLLKVENSTLQDSVESYITKNGDLITKFESVEVEKENLKKSLELAGFEIADLKDKDVKWRKLTNALQLELQSAGSGEATVHDTIYITVNPDTNEADTVKMLRIDPWTNNSLSLFNSRIDLGLKKHFFDYTYDVRMKLLIEGTRKVPVVTAVLDDTHAKIVTGNSITVPYKTKWYEKPWIWGLGGITAGYFIFK